MRLSWTVVGASAALALVHGVSHARPGPDAGAEADAAPPAPPAPLFEQGVALRDRDDWDGACSKFYEAVRTEPTAEVLFALGECREREQDWTAASVRYRGAIDLAHAAGDRETATRAAKRDAEIVAETVLLKVNRFLVERDAWVAFSIDDRPLAPEPVLLAIRVGPGTHTLRAVRPGCARWSRVVQGKPGGVILIEIPSLGCFPAPKASFAITSGRRTVAPKSRILYSTSFVGGLGIGMALVLEFQASGKRTNAAAYDCDSDRCRDPVGRQYLSQAGELRTAAIISAIVGTVVLGTSLWVLFRDDDDDSIVKSAGLDVTPPGSGSGAVVTVGGTF